MTKEAFHVAWNLHKQILDCKTTLEQSLTADSVNVYIPKWMAKIVAPAIEEHMKKLEKDFKKI